jgi:hypothetical protein
MPPECTVDWVLGVIGAGARIVPRLPKTAVNRFGSCNLEQQPA